MYYLNSRYYDQNTCRFINADGYVNANGDLVGFNMFAYCSNNPVMFTDPTGNWNEESFFYQVIVKNISISAGVSLGFQIQAKYKKTTVEWDNKIDIIGISVKDGELKIGHPATCSASASYEIVPDLDIKYSYREDSFESFDGDREGDGEFEHDLSLEAGKGSSFIVGAHYEISISLSGIWRSIRKFFSF